MYQFNIFVYFLLLGTTVWLKNYYLTLLVLIIGVLILAFIPLFRKVKKESIRKHIKEYPDLPCLNINKAAWWELAELPGVSRAQAKRAVLIRINQGFYQTKTDFLTINGIKDTPELQKLIEV